jgi:hypothetical protein
VVRITYLVYASATAKERGAHTKSKRWYNIPFLNKVKVAGIPVKEECLLL